MSRCVWLAGLSWHRNLSPRESSSTESVPFSNRPRIFEGSWLKSAFTSPPAARLRLKHPGASLSLYPPKSRLNVLKLAAYPVNTKSFSFAARNSPAKLRCSILPLVGFFMVVHLSCNVCCVLLPRLAPLNHSTEAGVCNLLFRPLHCIARGQIDESKK